MLYAGAVALLLAVAAECAETVARARGWPVRGVWMGALLGSVLLPVAAALLPAAPFRSAEVDGPVAPIAAEAARPSALLARAANPWLLGAWGLGSGVALAAMAASYLRLRRRGREWSFRTVDGHGIWASRDVGPAAIGLRRGRIVVPEWVLAWDAGRRALVLAHEDEHLRARDPGLLLGALLLIAAFPWNPGLWWQWRRLREAVELDCDLRVLARGADPAAYGRVLVEVTEQGHSHRLAVAAISRPSSFLERRIRTMLEPRIRRWTIRAAGTTLLSGVLVLAACQVDRPQQTLVPATGTTFPTQGGAAAPRVAVAETGAITGMVLDASGRPVEGARVEVANSGAVSSPDGSFRLIRIPAGAHTLRALAPGGRGKALSRRVEVTAGQTTTVRIGF
jgi:beta-lactamase regulating signal transducer with metallopeptidase domain